MDLLFLPNLMVVLVEKELAVAAVEMDIRELPALAVLEEVVLLWLLTKLEPMISLHSQHLEEMKPQQQMDILITSILEQAPLQ
jgi:hypothetical protein